MTEAYASYTVRANDTLHGLSQTLLKQPSQWGEVARLNGMKNPNLIYPGQVIDIPRSLLNPNSQSRIELPGKVVSVSGDVKLGGQAMIAGAAVPEGAKLQTGVNSSAVIQLGDGSRVQLMPRTIAEVTTQHAYALRDPSSSASSTWFSGAIRLVEGVLDILAEKRANRIGPLEVTTPTSLVGVRGTQFRVAYEDPASGVARTEVIEGKVRSDISAQKTGADVSGGFGAAVKPTDREVKVVALLPALAQPQLPAQVVRTDGNQAAWTVGTISGAAGYRAQFATDEQFAQIRGEFKSATPALNVSELPDGNYYARVRGVDPAGIEGFDAVRSVQIQPMPLKLVWPGEINFGAYIRYTADGALLKAYDRSIDKPTQLMVQIARDAAFTQSLQTVQLAADSTALLPSLAPGQRHFVRFVGSNNGQETRSGVFAMNVPADWGTTVLGMAQALQPVR